MMTKLTAFIHSRMVGPSAAIRVPVRRLYGSGLTIKEVVGQVGYSYGTIRRVLHEHGVEMRATGIGRCKAPEE
jgi:hypothetical protein